MGLRAESSTSGHQVEAQFDSPGDNNAMRSDDCGVPTPAASIATSRATVAAIPADAALSSSNNFGSRVLELLGPPRSDRRTCNVDVLPTAPQIRQERGPIPNLPNEADARRIVDAAHFFVGQTQSHCDSRVLLDRMDVFYSQADNTAQTNTLWFLQMLVMFAVGKLFLAECEEGSEADEAPGNKLFEFAVANLPPLSEQYAHRTLAVETLALMGLYLQNIDRQLEAYIYTSTALRLAVAHGFHRKSRVRHLLPSERVQLNRLWWTVYMQDRRLAAATGNPFGITDESIDLDMPSDSPGFSPAAPLQLNIKIAKITGRIIRVLYGTRDRTEVDFVTKVQEIIYSLYDVSKEISAEVNTDVRAPGPPLRTRTSASLQLMLLQATLLTIRPIMLHVAQLILTGNLASGESLIASSLGKLSRICSEAARRLLNVVMALKGRKMLAFFGFFDCDATLSATFVLILTAIFDSACKNDQRVDSSPGVEEALETLQYMAVNKNRYAIRGLEEVKKVWEIVKTYLEEKQTRLRSSPVPEHGETHGAARDPERIDFNGDPSTNQEPLDQQIGTGGQEGSTEALSGDSHWYTDINQTEGEFGEVGMLGGVQQVVLPNALWDDISDLWHPLGEFNEGIFSEIHPNEQDIEDGQMHFQNFLNNLI
ncbi:transcriptional regulatory protein [Paramyrothecium foliicola]|nr:transcriptional regulatory protein [Paramyrothecium foliicola]